MVSMLRTLFGGRGKTRACPRAGPPATRFRPALESLEARVVPVIIPPVSPNGEMTLSGFVYCDDDNDGNKDEGEVGIKDVVLQVKRKGKVVQTVKTDENGFYIFQNLKRGTYSICETFIPPDSPVTGDGIEKLGQIVGGNGKKSPGQIVNGQFTKIVLRAGQRGENYCFGEMCESGQVDGFKFEDSNGNGIFDEGEKGLEGWTIYVDLNKNGKFDPNEPHGVTDKDGNTWLLKLKPAKYEIREVPQPGWVQTFPGNGGVNNVDVKANEAVFAAFGNIRDTKDKGYPV